MKSYEVMLCVFFFKLCVSLIGVVNHIEILSTVYHCLMVLTTLNLKLCIYIVICYILLPSRCEIQEQVEQPL